MGLAIVVPTYNESLNIPLLVPRLLACAQDLEVFIADDGSPDGTGEVADQLAASNPARVHVLHRPAKGGRGAAVLAGFLAARSTGRYDWFGEMDADLSHQPEELARFLVVREGADMVVGSRYIPGGGIEGWSWRRRVWSRTSNRIIRAVLGVPMTDFTNGYRLYSRAAVDHLAGRTLRETGYISLSEWAFAIHRAGFTIREVHTTFINRRYGVSNMSLAEAVGALRALVRMRRHAAGY